MEPALTSLGVPGRPLGNPPMMVFNLGHGGVPWGQQRGSPVAGQLSGTQMRAGLTHLTLCVPVLASRGLSSSRSPALQLGPKGRLW
jgi:hypothetical protein